MDVRKDETEEILTDLPDIYQELQEAAGDRFSGSGAVLYGQLSPVCPVPPGCGPDRALGRTVWLRSGGYLVIEPTEAMTVIDVNTGKNTDKKTASETYLKTNLEAAEEIAVQLRLRNLSGIIVVDFIDMKEKAQNEELMKRLRQCLAADPVKTVLVDMTPLGLVEITRKKTLRPLHEQFSRSEKNR